eukprot:11226211-Lingulodinium_polyedra.AAC.1
MFGAHSVRLRGAAAARSGRVRRVFAARGGIFAAFSRRFEPRQPNNEAHNKNLFLSVPAAETLQKIVVALRALAW